MIAAVVSILEFSILIFATVRALFSIVSPKVQHGVYSLLFVLPVSIVLPIFISRAEGKEIEEPHKHH
uniref:Uncharacterized protein n=1 Tax=Acrobeloides nanus TaxID=290746 RepID=A0A914EES7_9BILA